MTDTDIDSRVKEIIQKVVFKSVSVDNVTPGSRLQEDLDLDSARLVDLVLNLEDEFAIRIEDDRIEKLKTFQDLINLVRAETA
jgi:acyl carrier protein